MCFYTRIRTFVRTWALLDMFNNENLHCKHTNIARFLFDCLQSPNIVILKLALDVIFQLSIFTLHCSILHPNAAVIVYIFKFSMNCVKFLNSETPFIGTLNLPFFK